MRSTRSELLVAGKAGATSIKKGWHMTRVTVLSVPLSWLLCACDPSPPPEWSNLIRTEGQTQPVPAHWLTDEEARIAHSLKLPDVVSKPVPFDFTKAWLRSWLPNAQSVGLQYFNHLCATEAGEWIFRRIDGVDGIYFARPQAPPTDDLLRDRYGPEMPWIQRVFQLQGDKPYDSGAWFIQPPLYNFRYVEQPRRQVQWQADISEAYIRVFGYTTKFVRNADGSQSRYFYHDKPMEVQGISHLTATYGYTWRGIKRLQDRENGIAGGEILIYDRMSMSPLAVRRQFAYTRPHFRGQGTAAWLTAARCPQLMTRDAVGIEFSQFAFDVLRTVPPSTTKGK